MTAYFIAISGIPKNGGAIVDVAKVRNLDEATVLMFSKNFQEAQASRGVLCFNLDGSSLNPDLDSRATIDFSAFASLLMEVGKQYTDIISGNFLSFPITVRSNSLPTLEPFASCVEVCSIN